MTADSAVGTLTPSLLEGAVSRLYDYIPKLVYPPSEYVRGREATVWMMDSAVAEVLLLNTTQIGLDLALRLVFFQVRVEMAEERLRRGLLPSSRTQHSEEKMIILCDFLFHFGVETFIAKATRHMIRGGSKEGCDSLWNILQNGVENIRKKRPTTVPQECLPKDDAEALWYMMLAMAIDCKAYFPGQHAVARELASLGIFRLVDMHPKLSVTPFQDTIAHFECDAVFPFSVLLWSFLDDPSPTSVNLVKTLYANTSKGASRDQLRHSSLWIMKVAHYQKGAWFSLAFFKLFREIQWEAFGSDMLQFVKERRR